MRLLLSFIGLGIFVISVTAFSQPFCVGNFTQTEITWGLKDPHFNLTNFSLPAQPAGQEWQCTQVEENAHYVAEVSPAEFKYEAPSCMANIQGGQWLKITAAADGKLQCQHLTDAGAINDVKEEIHGQASGWVLRGIVVSTDRIEGADIRLRDPSGKVILTRPHATAKNGFFAIRVPTPELKGYVVEADAGHIGNRQMSEHLAAEIGSDYDVEDVALVHLNVATTLAHVYHQHQPTLDEGEVQDRVRSFLNLSQFIDFGYSFENRYSTAFSAVTFASEAAQNGGWEHFVNLLGHEMSVSDVTVHNFPAAALPTAMPNGIGEDLAGDFMKKLASLTASAIFSKFGKGIGLPDKDDLIIDTLNRVMARLEDIQNTLSRIEQKIDEADYNKHALELWTGYSEYRAIVDQIKATSDQANANLGPDGEPVDPVIKKYVIKAGESYANQILIRRMNYVAKAYSYMITDGTIPPMQKLFAGVVFAKLSIMDKKYFDVLNDQLQEYRSFQAMVTALLIDAQRVDNPVEANSQLVVARHYLDEEKLVYPDHPIFKDQEAVNLMLHGQALLDMQRKRLWKTTYLTLFSAQIRSARDCDQVAKRLTEGAYHPPFDERPIVELIDDMKLTGKKFVDVAKTLGFSKQEAEETKMITIRCDSTGSGKIMWFGNDHDLSSHYLDSYGAFEDAQHKLNYLNISALVYRDMN